MDAIIWVWNNSIGTWKFLEPIDLDILGHFLQKKGKVDAIYILHHWVTGINRPPWILGGIDSLYICDTFTKQPNFELHWK